MRAHVMNGTKIENTVEVDDISAIPGLVDASIGGSIGDEVIDGVVLSAPPPIRTKDMIQAEIDTLERKELAGRYLRESALVSAQLEAGRMGEKMSADEASPYFGQPAATIAAALLAANAGYQKALAFDGVIRALRAEMVTAP